LANSVQIIKLGMLFVGSAITAIATGRATLTSLREVAPTRYEAGVFSETYAGEKWLEIDGRLAREYADLRPSSRSKGRANLDVPVVPPDWSPDRPVALIASFSIDSSVPLDWEELCQGERCELLRGEVRAGLFGPAPNDFPERVPELRFVDDPVAINIGTEPTPPWTLGGLSVFMCLTALASGLGLRGEYLERCGGGGGGP
jgi:hypothetical protein